MGQGHFLGDCRTVDPEFPLLRALCPVGAQIGFARVITDKPTFAHLVDVFIVPF